MLSKAGNVEAERYLSLNWQHESWLRYSATPLAIAERDGSEMRGGILRRTYGQICRAQGMHAEGRWRWCYIGR